MSPSATTPALPSAAGVTGSGSTVATQVTPRPANASGRPISSQARACCGECRVPLASVVISRGSHASMGDVSMISRFCSRALSAVSSSPSLGCTSGSRSAKRVCTTTRTWPAAARVASALPSSSVSLVTSARPGR